MDIGRVIRRLRHQKQWTLQDLCEAAGGVVYSGHLSRIERNELTPSVYIVAKIAKALNISVDNLIKEADGEAVINTSSEPLIKVPVLSWVQAGEWTESPSSVDTEGMDTIIVPRTKTPKRTYALKIRGESMQAPTGMSFPDGCYILVNPDTRPEHKSYVVCIQRDSNEATFKQFIDEGQRKYLNPLNTRFPVLDVNEDTIFCGVAFDMVCHL